MMRSPDKIRPGPSDDDDDDNDDDADDDNDDDNDDDDDLESKSLWCKHIGSCLYESQDQILARTDAKHILVHIRKKYAES